MTYPTEISSPKSNPSAVDSDSFANAVSGASPKQIPLELPKPTHIRLKRAKLDPALQAGIEISGDGVIRSSGNLGHGQPTQTGAPGESRRRLFASIRPGLYGMAAKTHEGESRDALLFTSSADARHELFRSTCDMGRAVETTSDLEANASNRRVAEICEFSQGFVRKRRPIGSREPRPAIGRGGKSFPTIWLPPERGGSASNSKAPPPVPHRASRSGGGDDYAMVPAGPGDQPSDTKGAKAAAERLFSVQPERLRSLPDLRGEIGQRIAAVENQLRKRS